MKKKSKAAVSTAIVALIVIIIIVIAGVAAYAVYSNSQNPQATPTPAPTEAPTATPTIEPTPTPEPVTLIISSTTSLRDTGLEDAGINGNTTGTIKEAFEAKYPWITVSFLGQGTGAAIQTAMRGDADMIMVHSPSQEKTFLTGGYGVNRKIIAYNFFTVVGPANDPLSIAGMTNVSQALINLYNAAQINNQIQWFSRNDGSGTATAEQNLWKAAGFNYTLLTQQTTWFHTTGVGMAQTLSEANNGVGGAAPGYTLSDTGTYLASFKAGNIQLTTIIESQKALLNVYSVIVDNPQNANLTNTHFEASMLFVNWIVSEEGQQVLANYGVENYGQTLFNPFIPLVNGASPNATLQSWIESYAYINGTECPAAYRYNAGDLYSAPYDAIPTPSPFVAAVATEGITTKDP